MRYVMPAILIAAAIAVFFIFVVPTYNDVSALRKDVAAYNEALGNSKALENERDKLTTKYNSLDKDELAKLEKLIPENVDNIRLILEIEELAAPYGMAIRDVKYNAAETETQQGGVQGGVRQAARKDYGVLELEFNTSGTYRNFIGFLHDLEDNLRIVDIASVSFSSAPSGAAAQAAVSSSDNYEYNVKIKTYWLKN